MLGLRLLENTVRDIISKEVYPSPDGAKDMGIEAKYSYGNGIAKASASVNDMGLHTQVSRKLVFTDKDGNERTVPLRESVARAISEDIARVFREVLISRMANRAIIQMGFVPVGYSVEVRRNKREITAINKFMEEMEFRGNTEARIATTISQALGVHAEVMIALVVTDKATGKGKVAVSETGNITNAWEIVNRFANRCKGDIKQLEKEKYIIVQRIFEKGKAVGYVLVDSNGTKSEVSRHWLEKMFEDKRVEFVNAYMTKDKKIVVR